MDDRLRYWGYLFDIANDVQNFPKEYNEVVQERVNKRGRQLEHESYLCVCRHYNSDTPIIPGKRIKKLPFNIKQNGISLEGGGYFLMHDNCGVVIDPGYGFTRLLYEYYGITVADFDHVIVTHDHLDHHADLINILALYRKVGSKGLTIWCNNQIRQIYEEATNQTVKWETTFVIDNDVVSLECLSGYEKIDARFIQALHWQRNLEIRTSAGQAVVDHLMNCFGLKLTLKSDGNSIKNIVITSDTCWPRFNEDGNLLPYFFELYLDEKGKFDISKERSAKLRLRNAVSKFLNFYSSEQDIDLISMHIGSVENMSSIFCADELDKAINSLYYPGFHLGISGCIHLLETVMAHNSPKFAVLTEFGEELAGHRKNISKFLSAEISHRLNINPPFVVIPADVGLKINLQNATVRCDGCEQFHDYNDIVPIERDYDFITYVRHRICEEIERNCQWPNL